MVELVLGQAAFQVGAAVHARRGMALEVHQVAAVLFGLAMPEMVLAAADHGGQRGERGDMAAQVAAVGRVVLVARTTIAMAFQRTYERMRASSSRLPGWAGSSPGGIVFT